MSNEEDREAIAGEISGVQVGVGYESTTIGITAALEAADLLIAAGFHRTPTPAPAPAPDVQALIDFVHDAGLTSAYGRLDTREVSELNAILQSVEVSSAASAPQVTDALAEHDAALIESLADEWSEWETFTASDGHRSIRQHGLSPNDWLRARAQQIREERADG